MNISNISIVKKVFIFILLIVSCSAYALPNRLINDVVFKKEKDFDYFIIKLSVPMHYTHHFPKTESRTVIINLRAFSNDAKIVLASSDKEKYRIPRKRSKMVSYLRVESLDNNVGKLAIQFKKKLKFSIKQLDKRTLKIIIGKSNVSSKITKPSKTKKKKPKTAKKKASASAAKSSKTKRKSSVSSSQIIYVLNLESYEKGKKPRKIPKLDIFKKYKLFRTRVREKKGLVTLLRLGFFRSKTEAKRIKRRLKVYYPNVFVTLKHKNETGLANKWFAKKKIIPGKKTKVVKKSPVKKLTKKQVSKVDKLFDKGKLALVEKKYRNAISYFTKVSEIGTGDKKQQAMEYIGLAREKNNQIAHAKAEYKQYLKVYPSGIGHERVKQRLEGLLTAQLAPKKKLVDKRKNAKEEESWELFSTISQSYRNQISDQDGIRSTTDDSVSSYFNTSGRKKGDKYDLRYQFDLDHRYDLTDDAREVSEFGMSTAYFDYISLTGGGVLRLGRQSRSSGGVLGRFDGFWYGYPISNDVKINFVAGFPVQSGGGINIHTEQEVFGLSADFDKVYKRLDISTFIVQQNNDGLLDRRAIGTEIRYIENTSSYFGILDYDIEFNTLNTIQFVGNWIFKNNKSLNFVYDKRSSPIITNSNALIGQGVGEIQDLRNKGLSDGEIKDLALARTGTYDSLSISGNLPLGGNYSMSADINISKSSATPETTNPVLVSAVPAVGPDYYYGLTFIGSNLFSKRDTNIVSLRQSTGTTNSTAIDLRSQFNLSKSWRMRPRIRFDQRTRATNDVVTDRITTSARFDYRYTRELQFQIEIGADFNKTDDNGIKTDTSDYAIDLSYIYDF